MVPCDKMKLKSVMSARRRGESLHKDLLKSPSRKVGPFSLLLLLMVRFINPLVLTRRSVWKRAHRKRWERGRRRLGGDLGKYHVYVSVMVMHYIYDIHVQ